MESSTSRGSLRSEVLPEPSNDASSGTRDGQERPGPVVLTPNMRQLLQNLVRAARSALPVLLTGETGSGKEVLARLVHQESKRSAGAFVPINCGNVPPTLVDSEFFGYQRGAFTGATEPRAGLFEAADGGTLFLDEIGELPLAMQASLLRVLDQGTVRRVGASRETPVNVRVVAATNRDLEQMCREGSFRKDLLFRLNAFHFRVPPLRERPDCVGALVAHFLQRICRAEGRALATVSGSAMAAMKRYSWPGNVREMKNAVERAVALSDGVIELEHLPEPMRELDRPGIVGVFVGNQSLGRAVEPKVDLCTSMRTHEEMLVRSAMEAARGNQTEAARLLGIPRSTLQRRLQQLGIGQVPGNGRPGAGNAS